MLLTKLFVTISGLFTPFLSLPGVILRQPGTDPEKIDTRRIVGWMEAGCWPFDRRIRFWFFRFDPAFLEIFRV